MNYLFIYTKIWFQMSMILFLNHPGVENIFSGPGFLTVTKKDNCLGSYNTDLKKHS